MLEKEKLSLKVTGSKDLERKVFNLFNKKNNSKKIKKLNKIGNLILEKNLSELKKIVLCTFINQNFGIKETLV